MVTPVAQVKAISLFPVCLSVHEHEATAKKENLRAKNTNYIIKLGENENEKEKENPCSLSASLPLFLKIREKIKLTVLALGYYGKF